MSIGLVTVVIPTFNRAVEVCRAIESVLAQSYQCWEVIVVDDGSTDATRQEIARCFGNDPRIQYAYQDNAGVCAARNRALCRAQGEFIAFLDSDDIWEPWKLELQVACLKAAPQIGMVWTNMMAVDGRGAVLHSHYLAKMYRTRRLYSDEQVFSHFRPISSITRCVPAFVQASRLCTGNIYRYMATGNMVHTSTVLMRRELQHSIGGFDLDLSPTGEDFDFHLRTCRESPVGFVDVASVRYRIGEADQLTGERYRLVIPRNFLKTIAPALERDRQQLPPQVVEKTLSYAHAWYGRELLLAGEAIQGRRHLREALRHGWNRDAVLFFGLSTLPPGATKRLRAAWRTVRRFVKQL